MALPATDNFNRVDAATLGLNWTSITDVFKLASNAAAPTSLSQDTSSFWNADTFPNDQYSQAAITVTGTVGNSSGAGILARATLASGGSYYRLVADHGASNNVELARFTNGVYAQLQQWTQAFTNGDVWRLEVVGSVLTVKLNGVALSPTVTDGSPVASGSAGIGYSSTETAASIDNWEGGAIAAVAEGGGTMIVRPRLWVY